MKKFLFVLLILTSCKRNGVKFHYEITKDQSEVLIKNYTPTTSGNFERALTELSDSIHLDSFSVCLLASNVNRINPEFKKKFFIGMLGKQTLGLYHYDTMKALENFKINFGKFKRNKFIKNNTWDEALLKKRFFTNHIKIQK